MNESRDFRRQLGLDEPRRAILVAILSALAYYAGARLGYRFAIPAGVVTLWPASGVMLGLMLASRRRDWFAIVVGGLIGSVVSDSQNHYGVSFVLGAALANGVETLAGASLVTWWLRRRMTLSSLRDVAALVFGAVIISNAATAILGAITLHRRFHTPVLHAWFAWWVGDGLGMLIVAPVVITGVLAARQRRFERRPAYEATLLFAGLAAISQITLGPAHPWATGLGPFATFPLLLWAGLRFGPVGAASATLVVAAIATWNAALHLGPFAVATMPAFDTVMQTYTYLTVASLCAMIPAAVVAEREAAARRQSETETRYRSVVEVATDAISDQQTTARALRDAEDRMGFALAASRVGTWEIELGTGAARWSPILEELHGLAPGTFAGTFQAFMEQIHPDDLPQVQEQIETATRQHTDASILYRTTWRDGSVHWISGVGHSFYDSDGKPQRAAGIGMDVTERRALEEQYRQSQKMEAVGQLAGGVAHDFNNLLTVIQGYGCMLRDDLNPNSEAFADLAEVLSAAERAAALTRQLLAFSRRQVLAPRALNLSDSLRSVAPMLRRLIGEQIDIILKAPSEVGNVSADAGEIEQVIVLLALMARDAMPEGGVLTLEITNTDLDAAYPRTHGAAKTGPHVMLAVSDNGTGMDAATAARVFEPFFTTKPVGMGTGLGLSTVYGVATRCGGIVEVYSEPHLGTTFKVYFPRTELETAAGCDATSTRAPSGSESLLVVEDDPAIARIASRILTTAGYRVVCAGTPSEAMDVVATNGAGINLLLTDVVLPEMSGRGLAEELSQRLPAIKVLYMSGYTDDVVVRTGVLERDTAFLQKPFSREALLSAVRETLDRC